MFKGQVVTAPCVVRQRERFSEVTAIFDDKFTTTLELVLVDLTGSKYSFDRCPFSPADNNTLLDFYTSY